MKSKKIRDAIKTNRPAKQGTLTCGVTLVGKDPAFIAAALEGSRRLASDEAKKVGTLLRHALAV